MSECERILTAMTLAWGCLGLFFAIDVAHAEHRGKDMPVNRTGYHMVVVIEDPKSQGKHVSMIDDKTEEECATATIAIQRLIPEAQVCCYHTLDQAKACGQR